MIIANKQIIPVVIVKSGLFSNNPITVPMKLNTAVIPENHGFVSNNIFISDPVFPITFAIPENTFNISSIAVIGSVICTMFLFCCLLVLLYNPCLLYISLLMLLLCEVEFLLLLFPICCIALCLYSKMLQYQFV